MDDDIKEPQTAAENDALTEELLDDMRVFLDDPVALLERVLELVKGPAAHAGSAAP